MPEQTQDLIDLIHVETPLPLLHIANKPQSNPGALSKIPLGHIQQLALLFQEY